VEVTLLGAIPALRPHVIARDAAKPLLFAAGIVGRKGADPLTTATRAGCAVLFWIRRALTG